jgi:hypothetical protein
MKKHYLHLCAYSCEECAGPVVAGLTTVRENDISKETDIRVVGAICLSCGHRQSNATESAPTHYFPPREWKSTNANALETIPENVERH